MSSAVAAAQPFAGARWPIWLPAGVRAFALAVILAACMVYLPWEQISAAGFPDRDQYLYSIETLRDSGARPFDFTDTDLLALLLNEYLWRQIEITLGTFFSDPLDGFLLVSLVAATLLTYHVARRAGALYALLFVLSPITVDLVMEQTRSALALGVFLAALSVRRWPVRWGLFVITFMLHTVGAVLIAVHLLVLACLRLEAMNTRLKLSAMLMTGLIGGLGMAFLAQALFTAVGDRRAVQDVMQASSIAYSLWWIILAFTLVAYARLKTDPRNSEYVMLAVALLFVYVFGTIFGAGVPRFLALALPLVCVAIHTIRSPLARAALCGGTAAFNAVLFLFYWTA